MYSAMLSAVVLAWSAALVCTSGAGEGATHADMTSPNANKDKTSRGPKQNFFIANRGR